MDLDQYLHSTKFKHLDALFLLYLQLLPTIVKLFASNDRAIRVGLLQHIDQFGESLSTQIVDEQVCIKLEEFAI